MQAGIYICAADGNILAMVNKDEKYRDIVNGSLFASFPGTSLILEVLHLLFVLVVHIGTKPEKKPTSL